MHDDPNRRDTMEYSSRNKMELFEKKHSVIRMLEEIPEIILPGEEIPRREGIISLKELFYRENMDRYHVDCLVLCKIARNMLMIQKKLRKRQIYPGLYALEDVYVDLLSQRYDLFLVHPERFQLLGMEQDYEWYPEDERIFGDQTIFGEELQDKADQRFLYKILIAASKGNVKIPAKANGQDYASLFYGTLPALWKDIFEQEKVLKHGQWEKYFDEMIASEEHYERMVREKKDTNFNMNPEESILSERAEAQTMKTDGCVKAILVLLRTECSNSLEISQMLYECQEILETEQSHGRFHLQQAFVYGDGVIQRRDFREYRSGYHLQIPQKIKEYSMVETLLIACEWMGEILLWDQEEKEQVDHRLYILSDGQIENNMMFKECLNQMERLKNKGCQCFLMTGANAQCEGWSHLQTILNS